MSKVTNETAHQGIDVKVRRTLLVLAAVVIYVSNAGMSIAAASGQTVLITGSNRGIGLEFVRQYAARGWRVIATTRRPDEAADLRSLAAEYPNVAIEPLDVTSADDVATLAAAYRGVPIDVLVNNAALLTDLDVQLLGNLDYALFARTMEVNAIGPMRVTEALLANVAASNRRTIVTLSSAAGAHGLVSPPANLYPYRASKAALNMLMHVLALDLRERGIRVALLNPGLVDTRGILAL
jgi:NAD(P)-dependent dehydrogenase (short-subunit alcohol dehydrogenase family)